MHRNLVEMTKVKLQDSDLGKRYRCEGIVIAADIRSILPNSSSKGLIYFELAFKRTPYAEHMRVFGTVGYVQLTIRRRKKLDDFRTKCYRVGYAK